MREPLFCPNPHCGEHRHRTKAGHRWWVRDGHYHSRRSGRTQRYRCKRCGCSFSDATFGIDYFAKKRVNLNRLIAMLVNGTSVRGAARQLHVAPAAITRRIMLLCRQALAVHAELSGDIFPREDLVADGFQSFWVSQYHPNNFNLLAGADSQYLFSLTQATLRRSGTMTPAQKAKRRWIEAADPTDPGELEREFGRLVDHAERLWTRTAEENRVLRTDKHEVYPRCLTLCTVKGIKHIRISSKLVRTVSNPLFAVNYLDREIRKDLAEHRRETVCFARNAAVSTARMWLYLMYHNYYKPYRISPASVITHAQAAGVAPDRLRRARRGMLTQRAFFSRTPLNHTQRMVWLGAISTPEQQNWSNRKLTPAYCTA